jgi:hypothetical protein
MEHPEEDDQIEVSLRKRSFQEVGLDEDQILSSREPFSCLGEAEGTLVDSAIVESTSEALLEKASEAAVSTADVEDSRARRK